MSIVANSFGICKTGEEASLYELKNSNGMVVKITNFGANIVSILVPDTNGNLEDVVLGFDCIEGYEENIPGFGSLIGRHSNRISGSKFELNGITYELEKNDGNNNLHSGSKSYNKFMYEAEPFEDDESSSVEFTRLSPHMEQGFPGNLDLSVTYTLTNNDELMIEYLGISDQDTIVNLTNHSYFNLAGHNSGTVLHHQLSIHASNFTPTDDELIPTGEIRDVTGTPMDFREVKELGRDINNNYRPIQQARGYDHNYVLDKDSMEVELCATLIEPKSKRCMQVFTDMPGMQLYTGNFLADYNHSKDSAVYKKHDGVCFETQFYPNSCNIKEFPSPVLRAGEEYSYVTIYKFSTTGD